MTFFVARVSGGATGPVPWVTVTLAACMVLGGAVVLTRRGSWHGVALALATLLLSPVSRTRHWVWVVPLLVVAAYAYLLTALGLLLATITFQSTGRSRAARTQ